MHINKLNSTSVNLIWCVCRRCLCELFYYNWCGSFVFYRTAPHIRTFCEFLFSHLSRAVISPCNCSPYLHWRYVCKWYFYSYLMIFVTVNIHSSTSKSTVKLHKYFFGPGGTPRITYPAHSTEKTFKHWKLSNCWR